jgi:5'-methylthioadenosine phosphorylase
MRPQAPKPRTTLATAAISHDYRYLPLSRTLAMKVGIITGSGTHSLPGLQESSARSLRTRFGDARVTEGVLSGVQVVHVSRHGARHERLSSHVDHRANVAALRESGVDAVLAVTVCGAVDPTLELGSVVIFDDLYFPSNRLPDGSLCSFFDRPGLKGRGHWIFEAPFSEPLRTVLHEGAHTNALAVRERGCYGHVDGPRFNSRSEITALRAAGVSAVSQTAGPEAVLAGEAELPYALLGYVTDYANGVTAAPTAVNELIELVQASTNAFADTLAAAVERLADSGQSPARTGTVLRFD